MNGTWWGNMVARYSWNKSKTWQSWVNRNPKKIPRGSKDVVPSCVNFTGNVWMPSPLHRVELLHTAWYAACPWSKHVKEGLSMALLWSIGGTESNVSNRHQPGISKPMMGVSWGDLGPGWVRMGQDGLGVSPCLFDTGDLPGPAARSWRLLARWKVELSRHPTMNEVCWLNNGY